MRNITFALTAALAFGASAWADDEPEFIRGPIHCLSYDGVNDDLLTAGLGKNGLQNGPVPAFAEPNNPTAAELRKRAIFNNYRALVDITTNGGYGSLYGPNIDSNGSSTLGEGKIAGEECLVFADDGTGRKNVTLMVQIPQGNPPPAKNFDPANPCIVAAPSSGSRGVYGAIATAGEAGLKLGCAVAYTDKGTGMGTHDLQNDTVNLINGLRASASSAGDDSNFTAEATAAELIGFNAATPNRFAFKHAHSQQNPEKDWGKNVLQSIRFAFLVLNERFGHITKRNTLVIASSVSNGGGASLQAAERDQAKLIDGVVVGEPQIQPEPRASLRIERGGVPVAAQAKGLFDYTTIANLLQVCAGRSSALAASPLRPADDARAVERCAALERAGLIEGSNTEGQANDALAKLRAAGWEPESDLIHVSHWALATPAIAVTYANTYGRSSVLDNLCGFSFGATDGTGAPSATDPRVVAQIFANGNGIPPTGAGAAVALPGLSGINIINNNSLGGAKLDALSFSPNNVQDYNTPGALCLRNLLAERRVRHGIERVRADGDLHGKPTVIVHGRADALVPVNHTSRPYVGLNRLVERGHSKVRYYEVTNAQHFDAFLPIA
ncbi:MAG TPA: 3-hydroxybutyrate oligomer hydrolase family protein, partial [Burkholderiales bacterium]|nr:3-hydroxybutyrate oligomer hydrolase family protein [Burkholderiales bacterium]